MKIRWTFFQYFSICISGLLIISASVNAGNSRDFILQEEFAVAQPPVYFPLSQSVSCMECHNGEGARDVIINNVDTPVVYSSHGSSNHPVGMQYDNFASKSPTSYVALARLDPRIKLEKGQVTCISCHETTSSHNSEVASINEQQALLEKCTSTKALTTGPAQTRLCLSCHVI